jgi:hypothetical protein
MNAVHIRCARAFVALLLSTLPLSSFAAVMCGAVGPGAVAVNNVGANTFGLTNGPYTCADVDVAVNFFGTIFFQQHQSAGDSVAAGELNPPAFSAVASTSLGFNHILLDTGVFAFADSEWADFGMIVGPTGSGPVSVTFTGHLNGIETVSASRSDLPAASVTYWLGIAGTGVTYQINQLSQVLNGGPAVPRTSLQIDDTFSLTMNLAVNSPFGMVGALSAQVSNGGLVSFLDTGALDEIELPQGYSFTAHGVPLRFDGTGFTYAPATPEASAIPEPASASLILCGLGLIAAVSSRRRRAAGKGVAPLSTTTLS